jgi:hypothetical protein
MGLFDKLLGKKPTTSAEPKPEQAILIYLQGSDLEPSVYEECDTSTLEDLLIDALGTSGEVDGNETGPTETTIFLYGENSEAMFLLISQF